MRAFDYYHNTDVIIYYPFLSGSLFTAVEKDRLTNLLRWNLLRVAQSAVKTVKWQSCLCSGACGAVYCSRIHLKFCYLLPYPTSPPTFQLWNKPLCSTTCILNDGLELYYIISFIMSVRVELTAVDTKIFISSITGIQRWQWFSPSTHCLASCSGLRFPTVISVVKMGFLAVRPVDCQTQAEPFSPYSW